MLSPVELGLRRQPSCHHHQLEHHPSSPPTRSSGHLWRRGVVDHEQRPGRPPTHRQMLCISGAAL
ncbi:hypothetical protein E2562_032384 [Oryza meyeriana var. granulata]|uniref:Uncharacterized protein n=1 Tax=Oryza meyeriana var. granulata TaxID=110450 RepID=A0A6G1CA58_9ORYZ|nr:hypothetical protein E2562_032384 [Oryza meyeriana var. granulata]